MKKTRIYLVALMALLALVLTACTGGSRTPVGTWAWECDVTEQMQEAVSMALGDEAQVNTQLRLQLVVELGEDGSVIMSWADNQATLEAYFQSVTPQLAEQIYRDAEGQGMSRDALDAALEKQGSSVSDFVEQLLDMTDVEALLADGLLSGYYRTEGDKLFLGEEPEPAEEGGWLCYAISGDTMIWSQGSGAAAEALGLPLPIQWTRLS